MINGDLAMAQMLLAHGAYVEVLVEPDGRAPIHFGEREFRGHDMRID